MLCVCHNCMPTGSERDLQAIFAIDELTRALHAAGTHLVQHALRADVRLHGPLPVPDLGVLGGHLRAVEARVQEHDRNALRAELLRHEDGPDVTGRAAHMVAVVAALVFVLRAAPLDGACLAGDDDDLGALRQESGLVELRGNPERANTANVNLLQLLIEVHAVNGLLLLQEIPRVVDHDVQRLVDLLGHGPGAGHIHHINV
mmetsp:Transcript_55823/g.141981  ORF Transcript_55823/g.141981 Transcript_55823/m.141981 type:complete len:202 (-) Transcript_55823:655-1260(-)